MIAMAIDGLVACAEREGTALTIPPRILIVCRDEADPPQTFCTPAEMKFDYPRNTGMAISLYVTITPCPARKVCQSQLLIIVQHQRRILRGGQLPIRIQRLQPIVYPGHYLVAARHIPSEQQWLDLAHALWIRR